MSRAVNVAQRLPWVTELKDKTLPCEGIKWGTVALKDLYPSSSGKSPRGLQPRSRCKNKARWYFKALKKSRAMTGNYCTIHLVCAIDNHEEEVERVTRWLKKNRHLRSVS